MNVGKMLLMCEMRKKIQDVSGEVNSDRTNAGVCEKQRCVCYLTWHLHMYTW